MVTLNATVQKKQPVLSVEDLHVEFSTMGGPSIAAVRGVSLSVNKGECLAIVGESGCGKSVTALSLLGLIPRRLASVRGQAYLNGRDIFRLTEKEWRDVRGREIAIVFQNPMSSFNPLLTVGDHLIEIIRRHRGLSATEARPEAINLLDLVGIPSAARRLTDYPHQMSGGMLQRIMIAMGIACRPSVLIADEPTTALDVTVQAQILRVLDDLRCKLDMALIMITHDVGVVASIADRVAVMYFGNIVEQGSVDVLFHSPAHPYTRALYRSRPMIDESATRRLTAIPGNPPRLGSNVVGCAFASRCERTIDQCRVVPKLIQVREAHESACWVVDRSPTDFARMSK